MPPTDNATDTAALVRARGISLEGPWGPVFGPLDLEIAAGGVTVLVAPPGAARTALMMTLCGRMKLRDGLISVLGYANDHRTVFSQSAICCFDELDGFRPSVTVQDLVTEQIRWDSRWYAWVPRATTVEVQEMCGYLFRGRALPPIDAFLADLPEIDQALMRIAVANVRRPPLLVVGRLDFVADDEQRHDLFDRLVELGEHQSIITADVNGDEFADRAAQVIEVPELLKFQQRSSSARRVADLDTNVDRAADGGADA